MNSRRDAGDQAEGRVCEYLLAQGLQLVQRNYRCQRGELDLIMLDGRQLVFIEVRQRCGQAWGGAAASVNSGKQRRLILAAEDFLLRNTRYRNYLARFDVVALDGPVVLHAEGAEGSGGELNWIKHAFAR